MRLSCRGRQKFSVAHRREPVGEALGEMALVRDHHNRHTHGGLNFAQQRKDRFARRGVEISSRFVGKENFGTVYEGACDGSALLFAAGEFTRPVASAFGKAHAFECFLDARGSFTAFDFGQAQREFNIFFERHARQQVERLENHAHGVPAIAGKVERRKFGKVATAGNN